MDREALAFLWAALCALIVIILLFGGEPDVMDVFVSKLQLELLGEG